MKSFSWRGIWLTASILLLVVVNTGFADDDEEQGGKGKGKGKGDAGKGGVVQVDLSKLPPELAQQLRKYVADADQKGKGAKTETPKGPPQLPPGLARKPVDHPGRVNWLKAHGYPPETTAPVQPPQKGKGKGKGMDDSKGKGKDEGKSASKLEERLDQLLREIEAIRKELKRK